MRQILLADSDPHVLLLCQSELEDDGYEVMAAGSGQEVMQILECGCPDLVVLEVLLPDISGFETLQLIKGFCPQTPVIFHSIYSLPEQNCPPPVKGIAVKTHDLKGLKHLVRQLLPLAQPGRRQPKRSQRSDASLTRRIYGYYGN